jgi:hypothetical protein
MAAFLASTAACTGALAGDVRLELAAHGAASTWRGDAATWGTFALAYRFVDLIGPYGSIGAGYGRVDDRLLLVVAIGAKVWLPRLGRVRPHAQLGFLHQHEESLSAVHENYLKAAFGIGHAIRHRAGGELGLGVDVAIVERRAVTFYAAVDANGRLFPDATGPMFYGGGALSLGVSFDVSRGAS